MTRQKDIKSFIWMDINRGLVKSQVTSLNLNYIIGKNDTSKKKLLVTLDWLLLLINQYVYTIVFYQWKLFLKVIVLLIMISPLLKN